MRLPHNHLLVLVALVLIFAALYRCIEGWSLTDCVFNSTMMSCLVGIPDAPRFSTTKYLMTAQAFASVVLLGNLALA